jgi:hypothetical protein
MSRSHSFRRLAAAGAGVLLCAATLLAAAPSAQAVDYRLELLTANFTVRAGDRLIFTIATPSNDDIKAMLTDPATRTLVALGAPITRREGVGDAIAAGDLEAEAEIVLTGPPFREVPLGDERAYRLNLPTSSAARDGFLRVPGEGLRAIRITLTGAGGLVARSTVFVNVVAARDYTPLAVVLIAAIDGDPTLQPDGSTVVGEDERERLRDLRDLVYRKPNDAPVSVRLRGELLDGLVRSSDEKDGALLEELEAKLPGTDVLVGTFRPTDAASYAAAGLKQQFEAQLLRAETVLDRVNGANLTTRTTWLTTEPIDAAAVDLLRSLGVTNVVATGGAVGAFGPDTDPSRPYALRSASNGVVLALADARYARLLDEPVGTAYESANALAAEIIAQRAEIASAAIGAKAVASRHVILASASGVPQEPLIATTLLRLLRGAPQVVLRRASEIPPTLEGLARIEPPKVAALDVAAIQARTNETLAAVESVRDVLATNEGLVDRLAEVVDVANDTSLADARREDYLRKVLDDVAAVRTAVSLSASSFTFGSRESNLRIPLTNQSRFAVTLRLTLASTAGKMTFEPPTTDVVLEPGAQREVSVAAAARANGLIPVELVLASPSGVVLDSVTLRVRVNAIAGLGRGVSAVFVALLAAWWIIHARRAMRKKKTRGHPALRSQA